MLSIAYLSFGELYHCLFYPGYSLTNKELKVLEPPKNILHVAVDVLLEGVHLVCPAVVLKVGDDLLHVVLQVQCVVFLWPKAGFSETVVEDYVDPAVKASMNNVQSVGTWLGLVLKPFLLVRSVQCSPDGVRIGTTIGILTLGWCICPFKLDLPLRPCLMLGG